MKAKKALSLVLLLVLALTLIPSAVAGSSAVVPMQAQEGKNECAEQSVLFLDGASPSWAKASHQPNTDFHIQGGNELNEAERREASSRSASEPIEPRNQSSCRRPILFMEEQAAVWQPQ